MNNLLAAATLDENLQGIITKLQSLMDSFWIYIVMALAAVVVIWGAYVGIKIAIAHKNEEKINARDMVKNLIVGMVNPDKFLYLPSLIAGVALAIALVVAVLNLAKRVYEIIFMYFVMPMSMSTLPLDDGARFKTWRETFITKIVIAYGTVFSVNIFVLLLPLITRMRIDEISGFGNSMFLIFMIVGGAMVIPAGQALFCKLFGQADDMHAGGNFLRSTFYGSRMLGAATFGLAHKVIHGGVGIGKAIANHRKNKSGDSGEDSSDKYSENNTSDGESTESSGESSKSE